MTQAGPMKRHLAAIDKDIDGQVVEAKKNDATPLEQAMLDKVLRPYAKLMEVQKVTQGDAEDFVDSTFWLLAVLSVECILNTTDKKQPDQVYAKMNEKIKDYADTVAKMLQASVIPVVKLN